MAINQKFKKGNFNRFKNDRDGKRERDGKAPSRDPTRKPKCANCGGEHEAAQCPKPTVDFKDRPCHKCGETGHISRHCPEKRAKPIRSVDERKTDEQEDNYFGCVADARSDKIQKPRPRKIILDNFITKKSFASKNRFEALADPTPRAGSTMVVGANPGDVDTQGSHVPPPPPMVGTPRLRQPRLQRPRDKVRL